MRAKAEQRAVEAELETFLRAACEHETMHSVCVAAGDSLAKTNGGRNITDEAEDFVEAAARALPSVALSDAAALQAGFDAFWPDFSVSVVALQTNAKPSETKEVHAVTAPFFKLIATSSGAAVDVYCEYVDKSLLCGHLTRLPDGLILERGEHTRGVFDAGAQTKGLMSKELKKRVLLVETLNGDGTVAMVRVFIDENAMVTAAYDGAIRDAEFVFGQALPLNDDTKRFFTTVVGDGVSYSLVRLSKSAEGVYTLLVSRAYVFAKDGVAQKDEAFAFFKRCVRAVQLSASGQWTYACGWRPQFGWPVDLNVTQVLAAGETVVFRYVDGTGDRKIAKMARGDNGRVRLQNEIALRAQVAHQAPASDIFVAAHATTLCGHAALVFDDTGLVSFESLVYELGEDQLRALAAIVWRDVRVRLARLHELGLVFGDVHVGNIMISWDRRSAPVESATATLVDCESICAVNTPLGRVLVRQAFRPLADVATADTDIESLRYCVAWALDIKSFRSQRTSVTSRSLFVAKQWNDKKSLITQDVVRGRVEEELKDKEKD